MIPALPRAEATQILVIRTALLAGLLVFGAVTWFLTRQGNTAAASAEQAQLYGYVFAGLAAAAIGGMIVMRTRLEKATSTAQLMTLYITGYAMAEGAALFGAVVWFLGGAREWYIAGLILLVSGFQILPVRRADEPARSSSRRR
jgi:hypothetical protein